MNCKEIITVILVLVVAFLLCADVQAMRTRVPTATTVEAESELIESVEANVTDIASNPAVTASFVNEEIAKDPSAVGPYRYSSRKPFSQASSSRYSIWRSIGAIVFILGLMLAVNALLHKKRGSVCLKGSNGRLQVLDKLMLDGRRAIMLVEADDHRVLVSVGPDRIDSLGSIPASNKGAKIALKESDSKS